MVPYHLSEQREGKLRCLLLALALLVVSIATPAAAQPGPGATPTARAVDPDLTKHEFNRGESIYVQPDSARVLKFQSVAGNQTAIKELADLVVAYEALARNEKKVRVDEAKRRELGLKKVALYDRYNLSLVMLKVPKSKMPAYLAYWPDFWRRVDKFTKNNPGIQGPGPFVLPREGRLASLREGAMSLAHGVGEVFAVKEAAAKEVEDYPRCSNVINSFPIEIKQCNPSDERYFYFVRIHESNYYSNGNPMRTGNAGTTTDYTETYVDNYACHVERNKFVLKGNIYIREKSESERCGENAGDNDGQEARVKEASFVDGVFAPGQEFKSKIPGSPWEVKGSWLQNRVRCYPSDHAYNKHAAEPDFFKRQPLASEPDWLCDN